MWEDPTHCCWLWEVGNPMEGTETGRCELEWADGQQGNRHFSPIIIRNYLLPATWMELEVDSSPEFPVKNAALSISQFQSSEIWRRGTCWVTVWPMCFFFSFVNCHLNYKIQLKNNYLNINNWSQKVKSLILNNFPLQLLDMAMALKQNYSRYILKSTLLGPSFQAVLIDLEEDRKVEFWTRLFFFYMFLLS